MQINHQARSWFFCLLQRCGDVLFALAVALLLSAIVNQPTVIVHVIGHPAYLTTEVESPERVAIKIAAALFCLCIGSVFDHFYKEKTHE